MWGISFPINIFTIFLALMAPVILLALIANEPVVGLIVVGVIVAIVAARRGRRRREAEAIDQQMRYQAEVQADAIARRLRD